MLRVYTYCSYRSSPVGFCLGVIEFSDLEPHEYLFPSVQKVTSARIKEYFSRDIMKDWRVAFKDGENYICVVKLLEKEFYNEDGMPSKKYGNFAFETDNYDEYEKIAINLGKMDKDKLSDCMDRFLIPDSSVPDAALKIKTKVFKDFIHCLLKEAEGNITDEFKLKDLQQEQVKPPASIHNKEKVFGIIVESHKKKRSQINGNRKRCVKVLMGAVAGVIMIFVMLLILKK